MSDEESFFSRFGQKERSGLGGRQLGGLITSPKRSPAHHGGEMNAESQQPPHNEDVIARSLDRTQLSPHQVRSSKKQHEPAFNRYATSSRSYGGGMSDPVVNTEATLFTPNETMEDSPRGYRDTPPGTTVYLPKMPQRAPFATTADPNPPAAKAAIVGNFKSAPLPYLRGTASSPQPNHGYAESHPPQPSWIQQQPSQHGVVDYTDYNSPLRVAVRLELDDALRRARIEALEEQLRIAVQSNGQQARASPIPSLSRLSMEPYEIVPTSTTSSASLHASPLQHQSNNQRTPNIARLSESPTFRRPNLEPIPSKRQSAATLAPTSSQQGHFSSPPSRPIPTGPTNSPSSSPPMGTRNFQPQYVNTSQQHHGKPVVNVGSTLRSAVVNSPLRGGNSTSLYTPTITKQLLDTILGNKQCTNK